MRAVVEAAGSRPLDTTDGVRVVEDDGSWALVLPDPVGAGHARVGGGTRRRCDRGAARRWAEVVARSGELSRRLCDDSRDADAAHDDVHDGARAPVDSMTLLRDLVEDSLDEGYARAAARRAADLAAGRGPEVGELLLVVGLVAVGLLLATAFVQTRSRAGSAQQAHSSLIATVQQKEHANDVEQHRLDRLRTTVQRDQQHSLALTTAGRDLATQAGPAGVQHRHRSGRRARDGRARRRRRAAADGADVDPRTDEADQGRVTDRDLQTLVNEVWAAGAEAVTVNGQRLTALSAIRSAGDAVLVDFRPLSRRTTSRRRRPDTMRTTFAAGFGGSYLQALRATASPLDRRPKRLRLPASAGVSLRYAEVPARRVRADRRGHARAGASTGSAQ